MADFAERSLVVGYPGGSVILFVSVLASLALWKWAAGTVSVSHIVTPKAELFYWLTILFSTLGRALGDWTSEGTGFAGGVLLYWPHSTRRTALLLHRNKPHHPVLDDLYLDTASWCQHG